MGNGRGLSATVIAQDESARIGDCLDSLRWVDEIIVPYHTVRLEIGVLKYSPLTGKQVSGSSRNWSSDIPTPQLGR